MVSRPSPLTVANKRCSLQACNTLTTLVSDVVMDGMNGIEAAIAVCGFLPQCTVLLMSGNNDTSRLLSEAEGRGHRFDILAKPVHPLLVINKLINSSEPRRQHLADILDLDPLQTTFH